MKGFRFRLEPVLTLRRHKEDALQCKLADSRRALDSEKVRRDLLECEKRSQLERLASYQAPGLLDLDRLCREVDYRTVLEQRIIEKEQAIDELGARVEEDRQAVLAAARDRKALEKLRETLMVSYAREQGRKEQKNAEEAATIRHVFRQMVYGDG
ncbi:MAG TPA: flagellar export protein FliJ [Chloroflexota bacterium]|nr:flagellar export protein FliJ [Chloroflexota bacterium]